MDRVYAFRDGPSETKVSSQDVRDGILDGSVMIYEVEHERYYNATGRIGD